MSEPGTWVKLVLTALAAWRVTHLLAHEDGPWDLVARFRARLGHGFAGKLIDCFQCLSLWVAAPLAVLVTRDPTDLLLTWLAISGAACLLERLGEQPVLMQPMTPVTQGVPS